MPRGIYYRSKEYKRKLRQRCKKAFAMGRTKEVQARAKLSLRRIGQTEEFREKVSRVTKEAMRRPDVRKRHLAGLERVRDKYGVNFRGGNGQAVTPFVREMAAIYEPDGYKKELAIATAKHTTEHRPPDSYKVDFGNPLSKVAIEFDGPSHTRQHKERDQKKTEVLESLGWKVIRIKHR
jgi:hypothetical protein